MKRNLDLVRHLLLWIEEHCDGNKTLNSARVKIPEHTSLEVKYHLALLQDAGFIDKGFGVLSGRTGLVHFSRLTNDGHEFLDSIRNDTVFSKLKDKLVDIGGDTAFSIVKKLAFSLLEKSFDI